MEPAGLYIHVPFCSSVCPYCDFAVTIAGDDRRRSYLDALELEIPRYREVGLEFDTVYLGGGTPSSLRQDELGRIVESLRRAFDVAPAAVLHLEVNPEDVTPVSVASWRDLGFDFVSLGVQSFDDATLAYLGRRHNASGARRAVEVARDAGFDTVSADLIFGLPGQGAGDWRLQLETALELEVNHLSCYQLTVHAGTVFGRRRDRGGLAELGEEIQADLFLLTHEVLGAAGWQGYEVSNFAASPDHRSRHNQKYWNHTPYLGLGPSAHSFLGDRRWWNRRKVRLWSADLEAGRSPVEGHEKLSADELFLEAVMLGLRTSDGVDLEELRRRFGNEVATVNELAVERLIASDYLRIHGARVRPTPRGMAVAEGLVKAILP